MDKINEFWAWFQKNEKKIYMAITDMSHKKNTNDVGENYPVILNTMGTRLRRVHKKMGYEFSITPDDKGRLTLFITPDGAVELFPLTEEIVKETPKCEYFKVIPFRQPHDDISTVRSMGLQMYGGKSLNVDDIFIEYNWDSNKEKFNITAFVKGYSGESTQEYEFMGYQLLQLFDKVIGEYKTATMIGEIDIRNLKDKTNNAITLDKLRMVINNKKT